VRLIRKSQDASKGVMAVLLSYDFDRFGEDGGVEIAREPTDPQECRLGCELWHRAFDLVRRFILVVPVRDYMIFSCQLLACSHRVQDQVLQSHRLLRSICDVYHLIVLPFAGTLLSERGNVLPEIGHGKDRMCALLLSCQ
jgi:hypothetical protein